MAEGISKTTLTTGLIVAILASSALSTVVATQLAIGPKGDTGPAGPQGLQGVQGQQGEPGLGVEPGFFVAPAYDSGWISVPGSQTRSFTHGLNTTKVFVYLMRNIPIVGLDQGIATGSNNVELYWYNLTNNDIFVRTLYPIGSHEIRVMIWEIAEP